MQATSIGTRNAAVYVRISQDRGGGGLGVARQEKDARALCDSNGWKVAAVFSDNDTSAYKGKRRRGYEAMLDAIRSGDVDALVAWHPDRLHRSPKELETFIDIVESAGVAIHTVTAGDVDLSTADGRLRARMTGVVARHESEHKAERNQRKHIELAENGRVSGGGMRPFGYDKDRVTLCEDEADEIRAAAARVLAGASLRSIVMDWNARGVASVTGARWTSTTLKRLLMSARISGQREHHGRIVARAQWPAIITPDQTLRLRAILTDPGRSKVAGVAARKYLLAGLVYCGKCGARMSTRANHTRRKGANDRVLHYVTERYACTVDRGGCNGCGIAASGLEEVVVDAVLYALDSARAAKAIASRRRKSTEPTPDDELADIEQHRSELAEMYGRREISAADWKTARAALDADYERVRAQVVEQARSEPAMAALDGIREAWPTLDFDRRRAVIATVLERVEIAATTKASNKFAPQRVTLAWRV